MIALRLLSMVAVTTISVQAVARATPVHNSRHASQPAERKACVKVGQWLDPVTKQTLNTPQALARLKNASIVLLGEAHTNADHHRWQLQTIAQLLAQNPNMTLGFESFPRRVQPVLDKWVAGKLTPQAFLAQSDWNTVWRFDPKYYMALFQFARINRVPMVALNVERSLVERVTRNGWDAIPQNERQGVGTPAPASQSYRRFLRTVFDRHRKSGAGKDMAKGMAKGMGNFEYFVNAQQTWDRAMAEAAQSALRRARAQNSRAYVVGIVGQGHLEYGYGLSYQLADMGVQNVSVFSPWDRERPCSDLKNKDGAAVAKLVFGLPATRNTALPSGPRLGVLIGPDKTGVLIKTVFPDTVAAAAGLKNNDIVVEAAGRKTPTPEILVTTIRAMEPGTWLPLSIVRGKKRYKLIARFPASPPEKQGTPK